MKLCVEQCKMPKKNFITLSPATKLAKPGSTRPWHEQTVV
nr:RNA polymerase sigma factor RpoD [Raoultella sp. NCTC 9187]